MTVVDATIILCDHGRGADHCRASFERGTSAGVRVLAAQHGWITLNDRDYCPAHAPLYTPR